MYRSVLSCECIGSALAVGGSIKRRIGCDNVEPRLRSRLGRHRLRRLRVVYRDALLKQVEAKPTHRRVLLQGGGVDRRLETIMGKRPASFS